MHLLYSYTQLANFNFISDGKFLIRSVICFYTCMVCQCIPLLLNVILMYLIMYVDATVSVPKINVRLMFFPLFKAIALVFHIYTYKHCLFLNWAINIFMRKYCILQVRAAKVPYLVINNKQ